MTLWLEEHHLPYRIGRTRKERERLGWYLGITDNALTNWAELPSQGQHQWLYILTLNCLYKKYTIYTLSTSKLYLQPRPFFLNFRFVYPLGCLTSSRPLKCYMLKNKQISPFSYLASCSLPLSVMVTPSFQVHMPRNLESFLSFPFLSMPTSKMPANSVGSYLHGTSRIWSRFTISTAASQVQATIII